MRTALDIFVLWPMPAIWLGLLGLAALTIRRRLGHALLAAAMALLFAASIPSVARLLNSGLLAGAPALHLDNPGPPCAAAVVVPTGGTYLDALGRPYPLHASVIRAVSGSIVARRTGLPLIVAGSSPGGDVRPEAEIVVNQLGLADAIVESRPRDTYETGIAVAERLDAMGLARAVFVVTDGVHIARTAASLRHAGVTVCAALSATPPGTGQTGFWPGPWNIAHLVPSASAFGASRAAIYEYIGIVAYLVLGRIGPGDL